jgi:hypothetical protein
MNEELLAAGVLFFQSGAHKWFYQLFAINCPMLSHFKYLCSAPADRHVTSTILAAPQREL